MVRECGRLSLSARGRHIMPGTERRHIAGVERHKPIHAKHVHTPVGDDTLTGREPRKLVIGAGTPTAANDATRGVLRQAHDLRLPQSVRRRRLLLRGPVQVSDPRRATSKDARGSLSPRLRALIDHRLHQRLVKTRLT